MAVAEKFVTELAVEDRSGPVITEYSARVAKAATQVGELTRKNLEAANATTRTTGPMRLAQRTIAEVEKRAERLINRYDIMARTQRELEKVEKTLDAARRQGIGSLEGGAEKMRQLERVAANLHMKLEAQRATNDNLAASMSDVESASRRMQAAIEAAAVSGRGDLQELVAAAKALGAAQREAASGMQSIIARSTGLDRSASAGQTADYGDFWASALVEQDRATTEAAAKSQQFVNELLGVRHLPPLADAMISDYEAFWGRMVATQAEAATDLAGQSQRSVNELLGVRYLGPLAREVEDDYAAMWGRLLAEQDATAKQAEVVGQRMSVGLLFRANPYLTRNIMDIGNVLVATRGDITSTIPVLWDLSEHIKYAFERAEQMTGGAKAAGEATEMAGESIGSAAEASGDFAESADRARGAMGGATSATAAWGSRLLIVGGTITAVALAVGTVVAAAISYRNSIKAVDDANQRMGGRLGLTRDQLEAMAISSADAGKISVRSAREMQVAFIETGDIGGNMMGRLISASRDYAALIGKDLPEATADLAELFSDPARGAAKLQQAYGRLDDRTMRLIETQMAAGEKTKAQETLFRSLQPQIQGMGDDVGVLAGAWERVSRAVSGAYNAVGEATLPESNAEAIRRMRAEQRRLLDERKQVEEKYRQETGGQDIPEGWLPPTGGRSLAQIDADIVRGATAISDRFEMDRSLNALAAERARRAKATAAGAEAGNLVRSLDPTYARNLQLNTNISTIQEGLDAGTMADPDQARVQLERLTEAKRTYLTEGEKAVKLAEAERATIGMTDHARAAYLARVQTEIELSGQALTAAEKKERVDAAVAMAAAGHAQTMAQATREMTLQTSAQERLAAAAGQGEAAMRRATLENEVAAAALTGLEAATRSQLEAQERFARLQIRKEQTQPILDQIRLQKELTAAYAEGPAAVQRVQIEEQARTLALKEAERGTKDYTTAYQEYLRVLTEGAQAERGSGIAAYQEEQSEALALAQKELSLMGESENVRAWILAQTQLEYDLRRRFPGIEEPVLQGLLKKNDELLKTNQLIARQKSVYAELERFGEQAFDRIGSAITEMAMEGKLEFDDLKNVGLALVSELMQEFIMLAAINPLKNAIFGSNSLTLADAGGLFGKVFGGFREDGGPVETGKAYVVGEKRPELFVPKVPGVIVPRVPDLRMAAPASSNSGSSGPQSVTTFNIDARGADVAAVNRLEAMVSKLNRDFEARAVKAVISVNKGGTRW